MKVCDKTCIFCFFPIINKYLCMAKVLYFMNDLRTLPVLLTLCTDEELAEGLSLCDCSRHSGGSDCVAPVGV